MKRILSVALAICLLLSCAVVFTGCSTEKSGEYPVTVGGVTIEKEPQSIVVLNDVHADIISYIGYDIKMVGRSNECDQDFLSIVPAVGSAASPDVTAITGAEADLVIADSTLSADVKSGLEAQGVTVLTLGIPSNEDELRQLYVDLGTALGGGSTGAAKGGDGYDELLDMLSTMNSVTSNIVQTVAYLYVDENNELCTFVKGALDFKFFNYNGYSNVFANQSEPAININELRIGSPNYLFYDSEAVLTYLTTNEELDHINALVNDHTLMIPKKAFERYGASTENAVFQMLNYIDKANKATPDEATPDAAAVTEAATAAATAETAADMTEAEALEEAVDDEDVISYSVQDE